MGKKGGNKGPVKVKKGPDLTFQKIKKARRCLQSSGKRGLDAFLKHHPDVKDNNEIQRLLSKAAALPVRKPKGQRGPTLQPRPDEGGIR